MTIVSCMNATITYVSPDLVFPRSNRKAVLLDSAPPVLIPAYHKAGWFRKEIFTQWFKHFICSVRLSKNDPVIPALGDHYPHSRNIEVIDCARENGVQIFCLSPHSTHYLQLLNVFFLEPLKTYYAQEMEMWI